MMLNKAIIYSTIFVGISGLLSCGGNVKHNDMSAEDKMAALTAFTPQSWAQNVDKAQVENAREIDWLEVFNDDMLNGLVQQALVNNFDLISAAANVDRANALALQAGAQAKPQVNLSFASARSGVGNTASFDSSGQNLAAQASWEADLWGKIAAGKQAAVASAQAAAADYKFAQHSLAASTSKAYFIAIEAGRQAAILTDILSALEKTLNIVTLQYENGLASAQDLALTKSDLANTREQLITLKASEREALRALEVLTGQYPKAELIVSSSLPELPKMPPPGLPSEVLERRPDIIASERRVAAAFNSLKQAKAAKLPSLSLTGAITGASNDLTNILKPANIAWQIAGNLLVPVFDGGIRESQIDIATAEQNQALAAYAQSALTAFNEVETNLDLATTLVQRQNELQTALSEAKKAYRIAQLRHEEGEIALVDLLTVQQRVLSANSNLVSVERLALEQRINLYLALGGDW